MGINRRNYGYFWLAGLMLLLCLEAQAQPLMNIQYRYYSVRGNTVEQIAQSLYQKTPVIYQGQKFHAYTRWNVQWQFRWQPSTQGCSIVSPQTTVDIQYTLPRLTNEASLRPAVRDRWQRYYAALVRHENGHRDFGLAAGREIYRRLLMMGSRRTCQRLEQEANQLANQTIAQYAAREREYDRLTNHGAKDGAVFP